MAVIYEIEFNSNQGIIDIHKLSKFSDEEEVLLQDGLEYTIEKVIEEKATTQVRNDTEGNTFTETVLSNPAMEFTNNLVDDPIATRETDASPSVIQIVDTVPILRVNLKLVV